ncbi:MAG: extracellular solute-binding protein [Parvularculales bacterium]
MIRLSIRLNPGFCLLSLAFIASAHIVLAQPAHAEENVRLHGLSIFGDLKYPPDFTHFDYVNPDAPRGGILSHVGATVQLNASFLSFDSLNNFILKGNAAQGLNLVFDSLMTRAYDEPDAIYGLLAESVTPAEDGSSVTFHLRPCIYFHDGTPLTSEDVAFSLLILKEHGHPLISQNLTEMSAVKTPDSRTVQVHFSGAHSRDLPLFIGQLPVFSKAWYATRDFTKSTLEPPLGSGPYRVGKFDAGRFITYERVEGYWGRDIPVNRGRWNFDSIRFEYFRDRTAQFEAFKAGDYLFREEFTSKVWATEYVFPAVEDGRVKRLVLHDGSPSGAQGWFINTRRSKFADPRVREALINAFDFEWTNKNHFYGLYTRTHSHFENSAMKATGLPDNEERLLLEPWQDRLPAEVFGMPYTPPVTDGSGQDRQLLRKADRLLKEAGWTVQDGVRRNAKGENLTVEFLSDTPSFERVTAAYIKNLALLGIEATIRQVDSAQYQERQKRFDFDLVPRRYSIAVTPGVELNNYWTSNTATLAGSHNLSGIQNPIIDALTETVINATTRHGQITAARALDRVLRAGRYWVPHWYKPSHHLAFWDYFDHPETSPPYHRAVLDTWWVTAEQSALAGYPDGPAIIPTPACKPSE